MSPLHLLRIDNPPAPWFSKGLAEALASRPTAGTRPDAPFVETDDDSASPAERRDERLNAPSAVLPRRDAGSNVRFVRTVAGGMKS
jgi:hypothetical protein